MEKYQEDNLIYNRFDLIYGNDYRNLDVSFQNSEYHIAMHQERNKAILNLWGRELPQYVFEKVVDKVFQSSSDIRYIEIIQGGNNYNGYLCQGTDVRVILPETKEELLQRLKAKHQYNLKRQMRMIEERYGRVSGTVYTSDIPDDIVNRYFEWKKESHGIDYGLSPREYLDKYHVTDALLVKAHEKPIGIVFYCLVEDTAYLENFSYNDELIHYSPGYLSYVLFLEELIRRKCKLLYLGGGDYGYKRRFGAEERVAYNGSIYRPSVFKEINSFLTEKGIDKYAIYGLGTGGEEFFCLKAKIKAELVYGIDQKEKQIDFLKTYTTDVQLPSADAVLITLKSRNAAAEKFLKQRFSKVFYWEDMAKHGIFKQL